MRWILMAAWVGSGCSPAPEVASVDAKPVAEPLVLTKPTPSEPVNPEEPPPPPPPLETGEDPPLLAGPERYHLPEEVRCDEAEPGPFCGVHVIDVVAGKTTTLISRDRVTWNIVDGKNEVPTQVEFVAVPRGPQQLQLAAPLFELGPGTTVMVKQPHPLLPRSFQLPEVKMLFGDLAVVGEKLYARGEMAGAKLLEIDPKQHTVRALGLAGKGLERVLPAGERLALVLIGKQDRRSVALYDVVTQKLAVEVAVHRYLERACRRTHHYYGEEEAVYVPRSGLFYVGFSCYPDA